MKKESKMEWVCTNCGSNEVQQKMWVYLNTNKPDNNSEFSDSDDFWCEGCQEHHNVELKEL